MREEDQRPQDTTEHHAFMQRCLELAKKGAGYVAPNPMVGAVLVYENRILGEGWHMRYGQPHAEVNCLAAVKKEDRHLIDQSTLYVSLEPCAHHGKTPPCADLIVRHRIPKVVIGCMDSFAQVAGKGIEKLKQAGIEVIMGGSWETDCLRFNRRFFTFHGKKRPFIVLKWAQTADGFIAPLHQSDQAGRLKISGPLSDRLVHRWRSENAAILVGKNTALKDDPALNTRLYSGPSPIRMALDAHLSIPASAKLMQPPEPTLIFNRIKADRDEKSHIRYELLEDRHSVPQQIADYAYRENIQSILIEGGATLLQSFIDLNLWDECNIITNTRLSIGTGLRAPALTDSIFLQSIELDQDKISYFAAQNG